LIKYNRIVKGNMLIPTPIWTTVAPC